MKSILPFTEEHEMFRAAFRKFVEKEMVPYYNEWTKNREVSKDLYRKMGDLGYLCTWADKKYGGQGLDFLFSIVEIQETSRHGMSAVASWLHSDIVAPYLNTFGSEELKEKYLPAIVKGEKLICVAMTEPEAGSDLASICTTALKDGNEYVINGNKTYITNGYISDLVVVAAKTDPSKGPKGISLILVDTNTPGFTRNKLNKIGFHAQDTAELHFQDVRVPVGNILGQEGKGLNYLMSKLQQERIVAAQLAQGQAERALEVSVDYARQREMFGKHLIDLQHTQFTLADMATEVSVGRAFVDALVLQHLKGEASPVEVSMAKYYCTEMAHRVASKGLQIHGGAGYCYEDYEIGRLFADTRVQCVSAGTYRQIFDCLVFWRVLMFFVKYEPAS